MTLPRVHLPDPIDDDATDHATGGARVSRFDVERLACGELRGDDAARVQHAIDRDPALQAFLAEGVALGAGAGAGGTWGLC